MKEQRRSSAIRKSLPSGCVEAHETHPGMIQRNCKQSSDKSRQMENSITIYHNEKYNILEVESIEYYTFHVRPKSYERSISKAAGLKVLNVMIK